MFRGYIDGDVYYSISAYLEAYKRKYGKEFKPKVK